MVSDIMSDTHILETLSRQVETGDLTLRVAEVLPRSRQPGHTTWWSAADFAVAWS